MMKKEKVQTLAELRDSKLLYAKDMPPFGYFLLSLIVILLIGVTYWASVTMKPYVVLVDGIVQSTNKNYVMPQHSGEITEMNMVEGQQVEKGDLLFIIKSTEIDVQKEQLEYQKEEYEMTAAQYRRLAESIRDGVNYFGDNQEDRLYYSQYQAYQNRIAQQSVDEKSLKEFGYTEEQIAEEQEKNQAAINEIYYTEINQAEAAVKQYEEEIQMIEGQLLALETGLLDYQVKAPASGRIHMLASYKEGMVVQGASAVASIASEQDQYIIEAYLKASDRSRITEGNEVDLAVAGLQQNIYGTIKGKVIQIDSDITSDEKQSYFKAQIEPVTGYVEDKEGKRVNISNGMEVEARIIYEKITYMKYILDALGFK